MTTVTLGDFTFKNFELPASLPFGGSQSTSVKKLPGGKRIIDVMGRDDVDISWSGMFKGINSHERAKYLDFLRNQGKPLIFTYSSFRYNVIIKTFLSEFKETYINYNITLEVIEDLTQPIKIVFPVAFDQAIDDALTEAADIVFFLKNPGLTSAMALLQIGISEIGYFISIDKLQINTILSQVTNVESAVSGIQNTIIEQLF